MTWTTWISIATKIGAVGSILFLAAELQQNRRLLEAESRYTQFEIQSHDSNRVFYENVGLAEIVTKDNNNEAISESESFILLKYYRQQIRNWEFEFMESRRGLIDSNQFSTDRWARRIANTPRLRMALEGLSEVWLPEFKSAVLKALVKRAAMVKETSTLY